MTRRALLALLGTAPFLRAEPWEKQPFPNWTADLVDQLLTDSPWAHAVSVAVEFQPTPNGALPELSRSLQIGVPPSVPDWPGRRSPRPTSPGPTTPTGGGPRYPVRAEVYLTVRWSSSLPIRQALALERWGRRGLDQPEALALLNQPPSDLVVEIFGLPARLGAEGTKNLEKNLKKTTRLFSKGLRPIEPRTVEVPAYGEHLSAELHFPRPESISEDMGNLEFHAAAGGLEIESKFKLKAMVYEGRLEL
jgi:hypothetical protein